MYAAVVSRVKILSSLDIAEHSKPQDGRITMRVRDHEFDVRVGITSTAFGERVVMRLLDKSNILLGLDRLGIPSHQEEIIQALIRKPHGMILVTGPTGSGKTTTLYAGLQSVNDPALNFITTSLIASIGQRLMRRLCPKCKQPLDLTKDLVTELDLPADHASPIYKPVGCQECDHTGYRGRLCVMEIFRMNDNIRDLVLAHKPATMLRDAAIDSGMITIQQAAKSRVLDGTTSIDGLRRVIYIEE